MLIVSIIFLTQANGVILSEIVPTKLGPSPRQDSTLAYSHISSNIFMFGGKNKDFLDELWTYNLITNTWNALYTNFQAPEKRIKALSFCRQEPEEFCIYGGLGQRSAFNDLWCFSLQNYIWNYEYTQNQPPFMNKFSSIHYIKSEQNYLAVVGIDIFTCHLKFFMYSIFRLDIKSFIWEEIPLDFYNIDRHLKFSIVQENDKIIIPVINLNTNLQMIFEYDVKIKSKDVKVFHVDFGHGGNYEFICGTYFQRSIYMINDIGKIVKIDIEIDSFDIKSIEDSVTGYNQSSCTCYEYQCYIFAGYSKDGLHNSLNKIDFSLEKTLFQQTLAMNYLSPTPRFNHKMEVINGDFWLFGGTDGISIFNDLWRYNPRKDIWIEIKNKGQYPTPRHSFSSTASGDLLLIWGGQDKNGMKNDFFIYNTNTNLWTEKTATSQQVPSKRKNACITFIPPLAYIYGGTDSKNILSDLWAFNFKNNTYNKINELEALEQPACYQTHSHMSIIGIEKMIIFNFDHKTFKVSIINRPADSIVVDLSSFYVVVGGRNGSKALNKVRSLGLKYDKEFEIEDYPFMAAGVYYNKTIYVFGGGYSVETFILPYLPMPRFIKIGIEDFCYNDTCIVRCGIGFGGESSNCDLCPEGCFAYYSYPQFCMKCSSGYYLPNQGSSSVYQCLPCPEGTFSENPGSKHCKICPSGKYCPIGSFMPITRNQTIKPISPKPQSLESFTSDPSSKISILLFILFLLIFFISISTKLRNKIKNLDIYFRSHSSEENKYIKIQKSTTGGFFTIIFLFLLSLILLYFICEFLYSNTKIHKTLIPRILIEEDAIVSDLNIDFYLKEYYDICGDSNPKGEILEKENNCGKFINSVQIGLKGTINLYCKKLDGMICHIWFKCENCTIEMNSYIQVYTDEFINSAKGIAVNVTVGSLIPEHRSSVFTEIVAQKGKAFSGPVGNNFSFALYPSYYKSYDFFPMNRTGFHVLNLYENLAGSELSVENYHENMRLIINIHLAQSLNGIFIGYSYKIPPFIIVCIGIGVISAVFTMVGVFMNIFEKIMCKRLCIKDARRDFSSILNRNAELLEEFHDKNCNQRKDIKTEGMSENLVLTSGSNLELC
ncbi:hypothetical protein SteCoe_30156 [Stentor coeruleus]|uniref:Tyrosine-protein kinase ephrin type A/B receptor-like domain-containing protein n=1 Tax=Stentor coeruleus TaxID=5963 RepID=A0A1R2B4A1_9CILI|nr:hypothetical protein SteCoe_30156 [Stentor coeruleus]